MRVLWVTPILPSLLSGTAVRQLNLLKRLASSTQCTVLSFVTEDALAHVDSLRHFCHEVHTVCVPPWKPNGRWRNLLRALSQSYLDPLPYYARYYPVDEMRPIFLKLLEEAPYDVVHFVSLYQTDLRPECIHLPTTLTAMDVETTKHRRLYQQETRLPRKARQFMEWKKLSRYERNWLRRYDAIAAMSEVDAAQLGAWLDGTLLFVVPNGVDTAYFACPPENRRQEQRLLFIGNMGYDPNSQGILYFCREILPLVRAQVPDVELDIVGPNAPPEVEDLGEIAGVHLTGFADVRPYLWRSTLAIVPLLAGSGTRLKIVEGLAAGCPMVSTSLGAEGLDIEHGKNILIADEPEAFARQVVRLLQDKALRENLSQNGKELAQSRYDWRLIAPKLSDMFRAAISRHQNR